eukprot:3909577-Rhodomonas_salina.3
MSYVTGGLREHDDAVVGGGGEDDDDDDDDDGGGGDGDVVAVNDDRCLSTARHVAPYASSVQHIA